MDGLVVGQDLNHLETSKYVYFMYLKYILENLEQNLQPWFILMHHNLQKLDKM